MIRTKAKERMERGLSVGLSIGFGFGEDGFKMFKSGAALLKHAQESGHDLSLFDTKAIQAHAGECRAITKIDELYEYSIVAVPANRMAVPGRRQASARLLLPSARTLRLR
jgi:hypothetical protein